MNSIIFQRSNPDERCQTMAGLLRETSTSAVVVSTCARRLADSQQPSNRAGHRVVRLFPCAGGDADSFNPLDVLRYTTLERDDAIAVLLAPITRSEPVDLWHSTRSREPAWPLLAGELIEAAVRYYAQRKPNPPSLLQVANLILGESPWETIATIVKHEGKLLDPNTRAILQGNIKRDKDYQPFLLDILHERLSLLNFTSVQKALEGTTFDLGGLTGNGPATIYIAIPTGLWHSHGLLARLWLSSLLLLATHGSEGQEPMAFLVDDAAGMELFGLLQTAQRHPRTQVEVWSFWESLGQLREKHPADWSAFLGGCQTVQVVGPVSRVVAAELAPAFGKSVEELCQLPTLGRMTLAGVAGPGESRRDAATPRPEQPPGHVLTFAPAQADLCGVVAPLLLGHRGCAVVVESAGAHHAATAAARADAGMVVKLDPFGVLGPDSDQFNPLDLVSPADPAALSETSAVAELIMQRGVPSLDPFWNNSATSLVAAVLQYIRCVPEKAFTLGEVWKTFHSDDVVYNLAVVLDTIGKRLPAECYRQIASFLQLPDSTRSTILSHVSKSLILFGTASVQRAVERTTFELGELNSDGPATIYIEIPAGLWHSHGALVRLWLSSLLLLATRNTDRRHPMTFLVDDAAGLGLFGFLQTAQRHPSTQVKVWSFWESLGQLREKHPADWSAFLGGCQTVQVLGPVSPVIAAELAPAFGKSVDELCQLSSLGRMTLAGVAGPGESRRDAAPARPEQPPGHVLTFAPAPADRCGVVAPLLLGHRGCAVVVESTGAYHAATAGARADAGVVVKLDPFGVLGPDSDQFNPLDLVSPADPAALSDFLSFTEIIIPASSFMHSFWWINTRSLIEGVLGYLSTVPEKECSLVGLRDVLAQDDVVYNLAVVLDTIGKRLPPQTYQRIAAFLQKADSERTGLVAEASQALRIFSDPCVAETVRKTSFDVAKLTDGTPATVYVELPPSKFQSHGKLVHMWLTAILFLFSRAKPAPPLLIVDNPHPLGLFPILQTAQRSFPGGVVSFWESLGQMKAGYPAEWSAFLASARTVEALGPQSPVVAGELASAFGVSQADLQSLSPGQRMTLAGC